MNTENIEDEMTFSLMRSFAYEALHNFAQAHGMDTDVITEEYIFNELEKWKEG